MTTSTGAFDRRLIESTSYEDNLDELKTLITRIESLGIPVPPSSRLGKYRREVERLRNAVSGNKSTAGLSVPLVHQAFLETADLLIVVEHLSRDPQDPRWIEKLRIAIGGHDFPQSETKHSLARDTQFELTTAAMCRATGLSVSLDEPDVVVSGLSNEFGIAVKRLKSARMLEKHLRKAQKQIKRAGIDGIVALDISAAVNPKNFAIIASSAETITTGPEAVISRFLRDQWSKVQQALHEPHVFGIAVYCKTLARTSTGQFGTARRWTVSNICAQTDSRYHALRRFTSRLASINTPAT